MLLDTLSSLDTLDEQSQQLQRHLIDGRVTLRLVIQIGGRGFQLFHSYLLFPLKGNSPIILLALPNA